MWWFWFYAEGKALAAVPILGFCIVSICNTKPAKMALTVTDLDEPFGRQPNVLICNTRRHIWSLTVTD